MKVKKPNVVGHSEAAQILGVFAPHVTRLRRRGRMPGLAADLTATPVWHTADIRALARGRKPSNEKPLPLVSTAEAATILRVDKSQIGRWRREKKFPDPCLDKREAGEPWEPGKGLAAGPLWWESQIAEFAESRQRRAA